MSYFDEAFDPERLEAILPRYAHPAPRYTS